MVRPSEVVMNSSLVDPADAGSFFVYRELPLTLARSPFKKTPEHDKVVNCNRDDHIDRDYQQQIDGYDRLWFVHRRDPSAAKYSSRSQMQPMQIPLPSVASAPQPVRAC